MSVKLGDGWPATTAEPEEPLEPDLADLRTEQILLALGNLRESLEGLPAPQVYVDAPDMTDLIGAIQAVRPGADPIDIAEAVVDRLKAADKNTSTETVLSELVETMKDLDFRMKGIGRQGGSGGGISDLTDRPTRQLGVVSIDAGYGEGGYGGSSGGLTDAELRATPVPVSGTVTVTDGSGPFTVDGTVAVSNFPASQPVTDNGGSLTVDDGGSSLTVDGSVAVSNFPATQPVSVASLPLPTGAAQDGTDITSPSPAMPAGGSGIRGWLSAIWTKLNGTLATSRTWTLGSGTDSVTVIQSGTVTTDMSDRAARLVGHVTVDNASLAVTGTVTSNQGTANSVANGWPVKLTDGTNTATIKAASTAAAAADTAQVVSLSPNSPLPAGTNTIGTSLGPTITKGTQGSTGYTTQDLKDAGRSSKAMLAAFTSTAAAETSISFQVSSAGGAPSVAATSYTVTAGKTLRIQTILAQMRAGGVTPAASLATFKIKIGGNQQGQAFMVAAPTTVAAGPTPFAGMLSGLNFPDGFEVAAGGVLSFTLTLSAWTVATNTPIVDFTVFGYEY